MAKMILDVVKDKFPQQDLDVWWQDLSAKAQNNDFYFAIDVVIVKATKS